MITLLEGDVITTLKKHKPLADVVVTSPPYNLGKDYKTSTDKLAWAEYLSWTGEWGRALYEFGTSEHCHFFLNVGSSPTNPLVPFWVLEAMLSAGWVLQNEIIWVKAISLGDDSIGHYKPINSPRFINQTHENIWHFTKTGTEPIDRLAVGVPYKDKTNLKRWKGVSQDLRCQGNSWFMPYPTTQERRANKLHPCPFPAELPSRCIRLAGAHPGLKVLDPFCGTGETLLVASQMGLEGVGIDLNPEFLEVAAERLLSL